MTSQGMTLRNMSLVGLTASAPMPPQHRPIFEEGVAMVFYRWTALQLGVQNEWGGANSADKAQQLLEDTLGWFYSRKDHEPSDLEQALDEALQVDFNIQSEDGSPYQVRTGTRARRPGRGARPNARVLRHLRTSARVASSTDQRSGVGVAEQRPTRPPTPCTRRSRAR
jgi:hypothetical protein